MGISNISFVQHLMKNAVQCERKSFLHYKHTTSDHWFITSKRHACIFPIVKNNLTIFLGFPSEYFWNFTRFSIWNFYKSYGLEDFFFFELSETKRMISEKIKINKSFPKKNRNPFFVFSHSCGRRSSRPIKGSKASNIARGSPDFDRRSTVILLSFSYWLINSIWKGGANFSFYRALQCAGLGNLPIGRLTLKLCAALMKCPKKKFTRVLYK